MADIFLSYARTERDKAEPIREALASLGLNVFFDVDGLDGGDVFPDVLDREVKSAGAVVSLWSPHALTRPWIKIESRIGKTRGVLIPVEIAILDPLHDVPAAFFDDQRIDLVDFNGDTSSPGWIKLVKSLARTLERPDLIEREVRSHSHSSAEAADLRAELAALRDQMGELAAAKAAGGAQDRGRKEAFALIEASISRKDYQDFLDRFSDGAEAFEASRRLRHLEEWWQLDKESVRDIQLWLEHSGKGTFPALAAEARRVQDQIHEGQRREVWKNRVTYAVAGLGLFSVGTAWLLSNGASESAPDELSPAPATIAGMDAGGVGMLPATAPALEPGQTFRDQLSGGGRGPEMVVVPAGSFIMGSPPGEAGRDEDEDDTAGAGGRQRTVRIDEPFAVGRFEVTWDEWEACVADGDCDNAGPLGAGGDNGWGRGSRPVIEVDWHDATAYARWLSGKTGETYRLLTEAEWEYVARGVTSPVATPTRFGWGDRDPVCTRGAPNGANFSACASDRTEPVEFSAENAFGVHDMHGNVWEWVEDCYVNSYSGAPTDGSARIVSNCSLRVLRGGSWGYVPLTLRSANRIRNHPSDRYDDVGFRVARTLSPPSP